MSGDNMRMRLKPLSPQHKGFITMIVCLVLLLAGAIFLAYLRVRNAR